MTLDKWILLISFSSITLFVLLIGLINKYARYDYTGTIYEATKYTNKSQQSPTIFKWLHILGIIVESIQLVSIICLNNILFLESDHSIDIIGIPTLTIDIHDIIFYILFWAFVTSILFAPLLSIMARYYRLYSSMSDIKKILLETQSSIFVSPDANINAIITHQLYPNYDISCSYRYDKEVQARRSYPMEESFARLSYHFNPFYLVERRRSYIDKYKYATIATFAYMIHHKYVLMKHNTTIYIIMLGDFLVMPIMSFLFDITKCDNDKMAMNNNIKCYDNHHIAYISTTAFFTLVFSYICTSKYYMMVSYYLNDYEKYTSNCIVFSLKVALMFVERFFDNMYVILWLYLLIIIALIFYIYAYSPHEYKPLNNFHMHLLVLVLYFAILSLLSDILKMLDFIIILLVGVVIIIMIPYIVKLCKRPKPIHASDALLDL